LAGVGLNSFGPNPTADLAGVEEGGIAVPGKPSVGCAS
jgi:hypothetical protein